MHIMQETVSLLHIAYTVTCEMLLCIFKRINSLLSYTIFTAV